MSHSRIFKLNCNLESEYKRISQYDFEDNWFIDGYHDYVDGDTDEYDDYQWLIKSMSTIFKNFRKDGEDYLVDVNLADAKKYLLDRLNSAEEKLAAYKEWVKNSDDKNRRCVSRFSLLDDLRGDQGGFYFYLDDTYYTDVEFVIEMVEYYLRDKEIITFRLEGTLDYHS